MIDSHCHLADEVFVADLDELSRGAPGGGRHPGHVHLSATRPRRSGAPVVFERRGPAVQFAAAVHPHRSGAYAGRAGRGRDATRGAEAKQAVAIGEIGLDLPLRFLRPRDVQRAVFEGAGGGGAGARPSRGDHTREATDDTIDVLTAGGPRLPCEA